jgi:hypothetical protein
MQLALNSVLPTGQIAEIGEAMTVFTLFTWFTHNVAQSDVHVAQFRPSFLLGRRGDEFHYTNRRRDFNLHF